MIQPYTFSPGSGQPPPAPPAPVPPAWPTAPYPIDPGAPAPGQYPNLSSLDPRNFSRNLAQNLSLLGSLYGIGNLIPQMFGGFGLGTAVPTDPKNRAAWEAIFSKFRPEAPPPVPFPQEAVGTGYPPHMRQLDVAQEKFSIPDMHRIISWMRDPDTALMPPKVQKWFDSYEQGPKSAQQAHPWEDFEHYLRGVIANRYQEATNADFAHSGITGVKDPGNVIKYVVQLVLGGKLPKPEPAGSLGRKMNLGVDPDEIRVARSIYNTITRKFDPGSLSAQLNSFIMGYLDNIQFPSVPGVSGP